MNIWSVYNVATTYSKRPSEMFEFETAIGAWVFDETCLRIGRRIERDLHENKNPFPVDKEVKGQFRSVPRNLVKKKKIKKDGTW